ncbi:aminotransferase class IV [Maribacter sp. MMG018]|uniref:aminotransferase class IV n=1 Tax=Maribacter sp. MMG018 TaxID=2822688 RepID=UPI001B37D66F|nr:aminotransferase class IV [Maribacter sp. MMG018]MBQ4915268.1 aminotransferase class IV [Maribacter sp. MMG018]
MVNFNGYLYEDEHKFLNQNNRGLRYGDSLFEAIRVVNGHIYFLEEHYLRLMSSMRILRMEIPMHFTMEFFEEEIKKTVEANKLGNAQRIRFTVFRNDGGLYLPKSNDISYLIEAKELENPFYTINDQPYEIELFKDFFVNPDMLSNLKTNNKILNVVGSVFANENDYDNCLLLNQQKQVVEALNGNIFVVKGNTIKTPSLKEGCLNGIVRKKLIGILEKNEDYNFLEESISPFELQKSDEIFLTNTIQGIIPVTKYRKKVFNNNVAKNLVGKLNAVARITA